MDSIGDSPGLAYLQVAEALKSEIISSQMLPGSRLPSIRLLAERYGIADQTVQRALRHLRDLGLIYSSSTRGYFVREDLPESSSPSEPSPEFVALMQKLNTLTGGLEELRERVELLETRESGQERPTSN